MNEHPNPWMSANGIRFFAFFLIILFSACETHYSPKPRGFYRLEFPEKDYQSYRTGCPFSFEYPIYAHIASDHSSDLNNCWMDVVYDGFNARLHLSYFPLRDQEEFSALLEDAHRFAYSHIAHASGIEQVLIDRADDHMHGLWYYIGGNVASSLQFFVTDSSKHYLRGALYFNENPQVDSLQPALDYLRVDVERMVATLQWK